jgi:hypothetical protein
MRRAFPSNREILSFINNYPAVPSVVTELACNDSNATTESNIGSSPQPDVIEPAAAPHYSGAAGSLIQKPEECLELPVFLRRQADMSFALIIEIASPQRTLRRALYARPVAEKPNRD